MIPLAHIQAWRAHAPWPDLPQIEKDLMICRALCDQFSAAALNGKIPFRGGTAIHKLLFTPAAFPPRRRVTTAGTERLQIPINASSALRRAPICGTTFRAERSTSSPRLP
jgi:hypothetical protein